MLFIRFNFYYLFIITIDSILIFLNKKVYADNNPKWKIKKNYLIYDNFFNLINLNNNLK